MVSSPTTAAAVATARAVFFDAVGTLLHPEPPAPQVYASVGQRFGSRLAREEIAVRFKAAFDRQERFDQSEGLRTGEEREWRRWRQIVAEVLDDATDPDACFAGLYEHFARPESWRCTPGAGEVLAALSAREFVLGLASNYDQRMRRVLHGLPALRALSVVTISSEVGWRKPAPAFFDALCRQVGLSAGQVLLVGDDRGNDYDGARAAGLGAVLFDPHGRESDRGVTTIRHLQELL